MRKSQPAEGVRVTLAPDAQAVHLIGKEVHQVARVYPLFDVAKILLAEKCPLPRGVRSARTPRPADPRQAGGIRFPHPRGSRPPSLELGTARTNSSRRKPSRSIRRPEISRRSPAAAFPASGWARRISIPIRSTCAACTASVSPNMPFELYSRKVRTERGEEAVNAWLETMKTKDPLAHQGRRRRRMDRRPRRGGTRAWPRVVSTRPSRKPAAPTCPAPIPAEKSITLAADLAEDRRQPRPQSSRHPDSRRVPGRRGRASAGFQAPGKTLHRSRPPASAAAQCRRSPSAPPSWSRGSARTDRPNSKDSGNPCCRKAAPRRPPSSPRIFSGCSIRATSCSTPTTRSSCRKSAKPTPPNPSGEPKKKKKKKSKKPKLAGEAKEGDGPAGEIPASDSPPNIGSHRRNSHRAGDRSRCRNPESPARCRS